MGRGGNNRHLFLKQHVGNQIGFQTGDAERKDEVYRVFPKMIPVDDGGVEANI